MENTVNLKRFRQVMNLTQARAAESIGIDQRQWNRYENGKNEIPLHYVKELCVKHKISLDWLVELKYENENNKINMEGLAKAASFCIAIVICAIIAYFLITASS